MRRKDTALGPIPDEWIVCPVGDFTAIAQYGLSIPGRAMGRCPILRMNCQVNGEVSLHDLQYVDLDDQTQKTFQLARGDILFNRTNSYELVGRSAIFEHDVPAVFASYLVRLSVDRSRVDPTYLNYLLNWDVAQAELKKLASRGVSQANISASKLQGFVVHLPSLVEQRGIAQLLSRVRSVISREMELEHRCNALKTATLREIFMRGVRGETQKESDIGPVPASWDVVSFGSVREWLQYGTSTRCSVELAAHPVLRIPNIEPGRVNARDLKYCDLDAADADTYLLKPGDLLFIRTNGVLERLGSCAVYAGAPVGALFASYLIRARLNREVIEPRFAAFFFGSARGTSLIAGRATPAADGKYNLNTGTIDSLPIPLPRSLDEQREIVAIIDTIEVKLDLHRRKLAILEEAFAALLQQLMTGAIRVSEHGTSGPVAGRVLEALQ